VARAISCAISARVGRFSDKWVLLGSVAKICLWAPQLLTGFVWLGKRVPGFPSQHPE